MEVIPIVHCFNNNYVIPAAVSFFSMLKNSNESNYYNLYVLHSDISIENQEKLNILVSNFPNAKLEFINMGNKCNMLFQNTKHKAHYSKEMYYKLLVPEIFQQYDKIMVTDVDVTFLNDISEIYKNFDVDEDYYLTGSSGIGKNNSWLERYNKQYLKAFDKADIDKLLQICGGYLIFNLKKIRKDKIFEQFIDYATKNAKKLIQPEQDTINLVCSTKIKFMPANALVCTYLYDIFRDESDYGQCSNLSVQDLKYALNNPIQLHYATKNKPWINLNCTKGEVWFEYLLQTNFLKDYIENLQLELSKYKNRKTLLEFKIPFINKKLILQRIKLKETL